MFLEDVNSIYLLSFYLFPCFIKKKRDLTTKITFLRVSLSDERATHKGNFKDFENEMISQLDHMVMEGGKGDGMYKDKFRDILMNQCEQHMALKELGTVFVQTVTRLVFRRKREKYYRCF